MKSRILIAFVSLFWVCGSLSAHHSFAAEYDAEKVFTFEGTVTKLDWTNPHSRLYLDVKDAKGSVAKWSFELGGPLTLTRLGWTRDIVKPGDHIKIMGFYSKDGSKTGNGRTVFLADGRIIHSRNGEAKDPAKYKEPAKK